MSTTARPRHVLDVVTPRRLVTTALLLLAVLLTVVGFQQVKDQRVASCGGGVIAKLYPCPGDSDLRQGRIGVSLAQGYTADLFVDGVAIPKDQLLTEGGDFSFTPGPGTETGALAPGRHTARVVYHHDLADPSSGSEYSWSFTTH